MYVSGLMILGVVFIVLKLTGIIDTHWVFVSAPFWIWPASMLILYIYASICERMEERTRDDNTLN